MRWGATWGRGTTSDGRYQAKNSRSCCPHPSYHRSAPSRTGGPSGAAARVAAPLLLLHALLFTRVRGRLILRSCTSAKRRSEKFGPRNAHLADPPILPAEE